MFIKFKRTITFVLASIFIIISLVGCQATPTENIIAQKGELDEYISVTAPNEKTIDIGEKWEYNKDYNSGRKLIVGADLVYNSDNGVPVASLKEKPFQSSETIESLIKVLFPEHDIFSAPDTLTKGQIEETILIWKKQLADAKKEGLTADIEFLENSIKEYEKKYNESSSADAFPVADYNLEEQENGSYQANLVAIKDNSYIGIDIINWTFRPGSMLLVENTKKIAGDVKEEYINPIKLANNSDFNNGKKIADETLAKLGIDYMAPSTVSVRENGYDYYYTRNVNGKSETYINKFFLIQNDNEEIMDLWYAESLLIQIVDGEIAYIKWENPSMLTGIDNDNVEIISFDNAKDIFIKQIDRFLAPDISTPEGKDIAQFFPENSQIHIDRIELGLTKMLMKNSNTYKLIPTWIFMGYTQGTVDGSEETMISSNSTCFVTINALDGSIVDRAAMY